MERLPVLRIPIALALIIGLAACGGTPATPTAVPTSAPSATPAPTVAPTTPPTAVPPTATAPAVPPTPLPATQTPVPPSATPTTAPSPTSPPPLPQVLSFTASPTTTNTLSDRLTLSWRAVGERAELCPLFGTGPADILCAKVSLSGSRTFALTEPDMQWIGYVLRVRSGQTQTLATVRLYLQCKGFRDWFFPNAPLRCPADRAQFSQAALQRFEHGFMVWNAQPEAFYVFDAETPQTVETFRAVRLKPGASPDNRSGETPPEGKFEPVSGFGMLWRGEFVNMPAARARLGWALEPERGYTSAYQCEMAAYPPLWNCYLGGPDGKVYLMRPDSTAGVRVLWEEK